MKLCSKSFDVITLGHLGGEHGLFYMSLLLGKIPMDNGTILFVSVFSICGMFNTLKQKKHPMQLIQSIFVKKLHQGHQISKRKVKSKSKITIFEK
jgi:hypothetical protein